MWENIGRAFHFEDCEPFYANADSEIYDYTFVLDCTGKML